MARLRPYLVRATYEWLVDHEFTPYFLVDAEMDNVEVPTEYIEEGKIVLNIAPAAVHNLQLENDFVSFEASFSGEAQEVYFPIAAVLAVYAPETGQGLYAREDDLGMLVNEGEDDELDPTPPEGEASSKSDTLGKGRFTVVK